MSVYNGFGTRNQEAAYNKTLYNLWFLTQYVLVQALRGIQLIQDNKCFRDSDQWKQIL